MRSSPAKTVLLVVSRGTASRFMLHTDVLPTLQAAGVRVIAVTPDGRMPILSPDADPHSLQLEPLRPSEEPVAAGRIVQLLRSITRVVRDASLDGRKSTGFAGRYSRVRAAYSGAWPRWISAPAHLLTTQLLWRSRTLRRLVSRLDVALSSHAGYGELLERCRPDLVVGEGLGYFPSDEAVYREAAKRGIPVAALISGWDNPTTKGYRAVDLDLVVAWSDRMREDVIQLHDIDPARVKVAGVPHWDLYRREGALPSRDELCARLGLDPSKRVVFHATFPPSGNPRPFEEIAITLAEATTEGRLGADIQLVIRTHPKFMSADLAARRPYDALARHEWVHVTDPVVNPGEGLDDELSLDDARLLGGLLKHCDVLVNVFSTTTLEAFLLDRPVVMTLPDPNVGEYNRISQHDPRRWGAFAHLKPLVDSGAARVARSPDELVEQVRAYLADPSLERERRLQMADQECGPMDGHAGARTAELLLAHLAIGAVPDSPGSAAGGGDRMPVNGGGPVGGAVPGEGAGAP